MNATQRKAAAIRKAQAAQNKDSYNAGSIVPSKEHIERTHLSAAAARSNASAILEATMLHYRPLAYRWVVGKVMLPDGTTADGKLTEDSKRWNGFKTSVKDMILNGVTVDASNVVQGVDVWSLLENNPIAYAVLCSMGDRDAAYKYASGITLKDDQTFAEVAGVAAIMPMVYRFWDVARTLVDLEEKAEKAAERYAKTKGAISLDILRHERIAAQQAAQQAAEAALWITGAKEAYGMALDTHKAAQAAADAAQAAYASASDASSKADAASDAAPEEESLARKAQAASEKLARKLVAYDKASKATAEAAQAVQAANGTIEAAEDAYTVAAHAASLAATYPRYSALSESLRKAFDKVSEAEAAEAASVKAAEAAWDTLHAGKVIA